MLQFYYRCPHTYARLSNFHFLVQVVADDVQPFTTSYTIQVPLGK